MSKNFFKDVQHFADVAVSPDILCDGKTAVMELCRKLIAEEAKETTDAIEKWQIGPSLENLAEAVDGAIDTIYVCIFFLNQFFLNGQAHWDLVHRKNMEKFPDGKAVLNEYGKVVKPPGWTPPDHMPLLIEWNSRMEGQEYEAGIIRENKVGRGK